MISRDIEIKQSVTDRITEMVNYLESKELTVTAMKFFNEVHDFLDKLTDPRRSYAYCRDPRRSLFGFKCVPFRKKYTIVFFESDYDLYITEFILSKRIHW